MQELLEQYFDRLFPIPRSLTGQGVRDTLSILKEIIDLDIKEVPSGTKALDWTVPNEWKVRDAYFVTPEGKRVADFRTNNLHLMGYSVPFKGSVDFSELRQHIITRPDLPDAIPYATSYYRERWGFCMAHSEFLSLPQTGRYEVHIDTELFAGSMTYGEAVLPGATSKEVLFTSYVCHPSMANNELSGPLAVAFLYAELKKIQNRKFTYRFLIGPETLGALYYLSTLGDHFKINLEAGFVVTCCGDSGPFTFKKSRSKSYLNSLVPHVLSHRHSEGFAVRDFFPMGSDERQYCSPGFDLPVACFTRSMYGEYPEYHTSKDNKSVINFSSLAGSVLALKEIVTALELEGMYRNTQPFGEPQLGKRGLYPTLMSDLNRERSLERILYLLNYADGRHSLLEIADLMNEPILAFEETIKALTAKGLLLKEIVGLNDVH